MRSDIKKFLDENEGFEEIIVALKGDGNLDGAVSIADSNMVNRSLISPSLGMYRPLTELQSLLLDLNNSGDITIADSNTINRSLISDTLDMYRAIRW